MKKNTVAACSALLLLAAAPLTASAAIVTLCGPNVCYDYNDDAMVNTGIAKLGAPTLLGGSDVVLFTPTAYLASAANGASQTVSASFLFSRVYAAQPGFEITSINISEGGDYRIINGGSVAANLYVQAIDLVNDGATPGFPESVIDIQSFSANVPTGFALTEWSLNAQVFPALQFTDIAGDVSLLIQNSIDAFTTAPGQFTFIQKKYMIGGVVTQVVPVPAAAWLLMSGVGLLAGVRRARS
jgi:hypothetical protein